MSYKRLFSFLTIFLLLGSTAASAQALSPKLTTSKYIDYEFLQDPDREYELQLQIPLFANDEDFMTTAENVFGYKELVGIGHYQLLVESGCEDQGGGYFESYFTKNNTIDELRKKTVLTVAVPYFEPCDHRYRNRIDFSHLKSSIDFDVNEITYRIVEKGISTQRLFASMEKNLSPKKLELIDTQASLAKLSKSKQSLICLIKRIKNPLLSGFKLELENEVNDLFGTTEGECPDESRFNGIKSCNSLENSDPLLCVAAARYQDVLKWFKEKHEKLDYLSEQVKFEGKDLESYERYKKEVLDVLTKNNQ